MGLLLVTALMKVYIMHLCYRSTRRLSCQYLCLPFSVASRPAVACIQHGRNDTDKLCVQRRHATVGVAVLF